MNRDEIIEKGPNGSKTLGQFLDKWHWVALRCDPLFRIFPLGAKFVIADVEFTVAEKKVRSNRQNFSYDPYLRCVYQLKSGAFADRDFGLESRAILAIAAEQKQAPQFESVRDHLSSVYADAMNNTERVELQGKVKLIEELEEAAQSQIANTGETSLLDALTEYNSHTGAFDYIRQRLKTLPPVCVLKSVTFTDVHDETQARIAPEAAAPHIKPKEQDHE